jgi:hypothetical protein
VGTFPVFNVADASITVGAAILFIGIWMMERAEKKKKEADKLVEDRLNTTVNEVTGE